MPLTILIFSLVVERYGIDRTEAASIAAWEKCVISSPCLTPCQHCGASECPDVEPAQKKHNYHSDDCHDKRGQQISPLDSINSWLGPRLSAAVEISHQDVFNSSSTEIHCRAAAAAAVAPVLLILRIGRNMQNRNIVNFANLNKWLARCKWQFNS